MEEEAEEKKEVEPLEVAIQIQLEWERFFDRLLRTFSGKVAFVLFLLAVSTPFIFDLLAVVLVWLYVWPFAIGTFEKLAVLGFLFVTLHAVAFQIYRVGLGSIYAAFFRAAGRGRKRGKSKPALPQTPSDASLKPPSV